MIKEQLLKEYQESVERGEPLSGSYLIERADELAHNKAAEQVANRIPSEMLNSKLYTPTWPQTLSFVAQLKTERNNALSDVDEYDILLRQLSDILERTANALKGEPGDLSKHSWHDLPEVAQKLVEKNLLK